MGRVAHPLLKALGSTVRALRRQRGLSQEALADLADIDRSYMSGIERGLRNISVLHVARLATALQVPLGDLIYAKGSQSGRDDLDGGRRRHPSIDEEWRPGRYLSLG